ncbi:MAG: KH domain-containing protein [Verrucomicrobium sp.]|nr:KH domain-containing protein [Verrucomicrobium sp.]
MSTVQEGQSPREVLELMLGHLGLVFEIEESHDTARDRVLLNIRTREPARLIGRDGRTVDDLQYLLNRMIDRGEGDGGRIVVDVEGYRQKEEHEFLEQIRVRAERVRQTGETETLPPMNAYERWTVHQAFKDDPEVATRSVEMPGGRLKQVVIERR